MHGALPTRIVEQETTAKCIGKTTDDYPIPPLRANQIPYEANLGPTRLGPPKHHPIHLLLYSFHHRSCHRPSHRSHLLLFSFQSLPLHRTTSSSTPCIMSLAPTLLRHRVVPLLASSPLASSSSSPLIRLRPIARLSSTLPTRAEHAPTQTRLATAEIPLPSSSNPKPSSKSPSASTSSATPVTNAKPAPKRREFKPKKAALTMVR